MATDGSGTQDIAPAPRDSRQQRKRFDAHLQTAIAAMAFGSEDVFWIERTRPLLAMHFEDLAEAAYATVIASPQLTALIANGDGQLYADDLTDLLKGLEDWVDAVVNLPLDAHAAEVTAAFALMHMRPRDGRRSMRARLLLIQVARLQSAIAGMIEKDALSDPEIRAAIAAWTKLLAIHLDLLLAVCSSAQATAHWY